MKKYYKDFYNGTACITIRKDGTANLKVSTAHGGRIHNKDHANEKAARATMNRLSDCWHEV
jgi:hypothetical protein